MFRRQNGVLTAADVFLSRSPDTIELIAHEVEHILEQLDAVDLATQVGAGHVWKRTDGAFETQRAMDVGRRVAREVTQTLVEHLVTLVQQDRLTGPVDARSARVSARGGHVVFTSYASLVPEDTDRRRDVYVFDLSTRRSTRESVGVDGAEANGESNSPDISGDGRYVVFVSSAGKPRRPEYPIRCAPNIPARSRDGDDAAPGRERQRSAGQWLQHASSDQRRWFNDRLRDGSTVAFQSLASDLLCQKHCEAGKSDANLVWDVYVHDRRVHRTRRASMDAAEGANEWREISRAPSLDDTGRVVLFASRHPLNDRDELDDDDVYVWVAADDRAAVTMMADAPALVATPTASTARVLPDIAVHLRVFNHARLDLDDLIALRRSRLTFSPQEAAHARQAVLAITQVVADAR